MTNTKLMILATMLLLSFCIVSAVAPKLPPKTPTPSPPAKTPPPSPPVKTPPSSPPAKTPPPSPPPPKLVSYNLISISWPTTLCSISKCIPKPPYEKKFTMHGVWPTDSSGFSVIYCVNSHEYKEEDLPTDELKVYWPGYTRSNSVMWEEEWKKHGRCSTFTPKDYFQKGLDIIKAKQQQIYDALASEGVIPSASNSYVAQNVHNALVKHLGLHPQLNCKKKTPLKGKIENAYLYEVRLCADLSLNLIIAPKMFTPI